VPRVLLATTTLTHDLISLSAAAFLTQTVTVDDHTIKFEIWDTAGQERYHSLAPMYVPRTRPLRSALPDPSSRALDYALLFPNLQVLQRCTGGHRSL
jgi:hypothetical protein